MVDCARSCQLIFALILLGGSGYLFWHFTGRPDVQDIKDAWNDFDVSDFTDVIADWTEDMDFDSFWDEDPFVGDNTTVRVFRTIALIESVLKPILTSSSILVHIE
jgi:hypothetical protein